jgi:hypothetical protein
MNARCPACGKQYRYAFADFGCSPACRYDWQTECAQPEPPPAGSRVRVATPGLPLDGALGVVVSSSPLLVEVDGDPRRLGFGPGALEVLP